LKLPQVKQQYVLLNGGLDLASPPIAKQPNYATTASNVEPMLNGGYRRALGYDRFDGRPSPSENKTYYQLTTNGLDATTDYQLYTAVTWAGGSGVYLFRDNNRIYIVSNTDPGLAVGAVVTIAGNQHTLVSASSRAAATRNNAIKAAGYAADYQRTFIGAVPGVFDVRGVVAVRDSVFAFRDADGINGGMYKATAAGWVEVSNNATGFGSILTVRDGYGIDDGDLTMKRIADSANRAAVAQMSADGTAGKICLPVGETCVSGDFLVVDTGTSYSVTLLSAISGTATNFSVETTGNQMGGITLDSSNNAGWYAMVSGKLLPIVSYLVKVGDPTKYVLIVSNPHAFNLTADSTVEVRLFTAFCEVTASSKITLPVGGQYKAVVHNFYGSPTMRRAYVVNGVGRCMELREDGRLVPLFAVDDDSLDKPILVEAHKEHLFLAFAGGQYQHSAAGNPLTWSGLLGAEAFSTGDEITTMKSIQGGVLIIGCRNRLIALRGTNSADWQQDTVSESVGVHSATLQSLFVPIGLSDNGLVRLDRVQEYGDFTLSMLDPTEKVSPIIDAYQWNNTTQLATANQYRLYSTSGVNLAVTLDAAGAPRFTTFRYPAAVSGAWRYDEAKERNFIALAGLGYVYELHEDAFSFDGDDIRWTLKSAYMHMGAPGTIKSWRNVVIEQGIQSVFNCDFWWNTEYRAGQNFSSERVNAELGGISSALWNNASWNQFYWNAEQNDETGLLEINGNSTSISFSFSAKTAFEPNFNIAGLLINYIPRRLKHG
jgi:hypothetical protein